MAARPVLRSIAASWWPAALLACATALALAACDGAGADDTRGDACKADATCGALVCAPSPDAEPQDLEPVELACGDAVEAGGAPHAACEEATDCDHGLCLLAGGCAAPCEDAADCAADERCAEVFARTGVDALQPLTACVRRVDLPDDANVEVEEKGDPLEAATNPAFIEPLAEGRTFAILEHSDPSWPGAECPPPLCLRELRQDEGDAPLFDAQADYAVDAPPRVPVATGGHVDPLVLRLPIEGEPGNARRYLALVDAEHEGTLTVTRLARTQPGTRLDLNVFYVGALPLAATGDRGPPVLAQALDEVDAIFEQAGIAIGRVRQIAISGELPMRGTYFPEEGDQSMGLTMLRIRYHQLVELPGLFRLSAGLPGGGINLFLLDDIQGDASADPEAESGGIPGPPGMHGTGGSGIAVAARMMIADPTAFGRTLAHELAHYLGLFHTSERDGRVLDNLEDTPECRLELDAAGDGLDLADCEGAGADNLMFWAKTDATVLTPAQRAVLRGSPILR